MKAANIHSFIVGLARDYGTRVGENAHLRSQMDKLNKRLKIARVLARPWAKDYDFGCGESSFCIGHRSMVYDVEWEWENR